MKAAFALLLIAAVGAVANADHHMGEAEDAPLGSYTLTMT
eukprot:CAMPEP_0203806176 /NCGR_PEP_ID=MMETSP0115-20131106/69_1 /ASSEMBLY_ACC=CAM_ASM_000227 /TAXON_ID=33651 /ORGANISM="Bicosoecid sp, Strain ms1" /LENGTH=39 /DNA_ID= /DNA_START= /DNA_END= /DNA_ORIENTATION=